MFSKHNIDVHGYGKSSPFPIHLFNFLNRFGGEFAPGGTEAASDCVSGGDDVRPGAAVERNFSAPQSFFCKFHCEGGGDSLSPEAGKNVNANLPHRVAVRGAACKSDGFFRVRIEGGYRKHVKIFSVRAESVAPFVNVKVLKIARLKDFCDEVVSAFVGFSFRKKLIHVGQRVNVKCCGLRFESA